MALGWIRSVGVAKTLLVITIGIGIVIGGSVALGVVGTPDVTGVDNSFGTVTENTTEIETDIHIHNPNPMGITLGGVTITYDVRMNDIPIAEGAHEGVSIEQGNSTLSATTAMDNAKLPEWWVSHLRNGERTRLTVHADVQSAMLNRSVGAPTIDREIETSLIGAFNSDEDRELNADQPVAPDPVLVVRETRGEWGDVSESETEIRMQFVVYNPREFPVILSEIGYDVAMNDVRMGTGETETTTVIPPKSEETIDAAFQLDNDNLDEWWVTHLQNEQRTQLTADFYLHIDLSEGGGDTVRIPLDTMERTIETDIFDERDDDRDASDDESDTDASAEDEGSTDDEESDSEEEEETPTESDGGDEDDADDGDDDDSDDGDDTDGDGDNGGDDDGDDDDDDGGLLGL